MFQKQHQGKGEKEIQTWARFIADIVVCLYLILMIAVMPFYYEDGYVHIATDKAMLCRRINQIALPILILAAVVYFGSSLAAFLKEKKECLTKEVWQKQMRNFWKGVTPTDLCMGLYGFALILSYLCSDYKGTALWGAGDGWYMGFLPQFMLVCVYFFVAKLWKPRKSFFGLLFAASAVVFLLGYLNRFSFDPLEMESRSPDYFISTIGHINWYCGYAVTVLFAAAAYGWQENRKGWRRVLFCGYMLLGFGTLVTQGSNSGIVTLGVILLIWFVMSAGSGEKMCGFLLITSLLSAACLFTELLRRALPGRLNRSDEVIDLLTTGALPVVMAFVSFLLLALCCILVREGKYPQRGMVFFSRAATAFAVCIFALSVLFIIINTIYPGSLGPLSGHQAFAFSDDWGNGRGGTWRAGVMCFVEQDFLHKITGVGPDAMVAYLYQDAGEELCQLLNTVFGGLTLTNAHNEWLTVLVNTGILGLVSFGGAMVTAIGIFFKRAGKAAAAGGNSLIYSACGFSLLAYTINNLFSFQQTVNLTVMMLILGMGMAFLREESSSFCEEGKADISLD